MPRLEMSHPIRSHTRTDLVRLHDMLSIKLLGKGEKLHNRGTIVQ